MRAKVRVRARVRVRVRGRGRGRGRVSGPCSRLEPMGRSIVMASSTPRGDRGEIEGRYRGDIGEI